MFVGSLLIVVHKGGTKKKMRTQLLLADERDIKSDAYKKILITWEMLIRMFWSWVWLDITVISALDRPRQEDYKLEASRL